MFTVILKTSEDFVVLERYVDGNFLLFDNGRDNRIIVFRV